ncbi:hypothetical protein LR48_Vigan07g149200 [Vigna angularis]|uniref:Protein kinase domain-containing protein n=1 Tax=Phaseolus angularis TaxID=3914 RepID=A0A0L9UYC9_PHAAN|nr:hypothetical protein LR48_Vigan07g149200 [Vigna angularis]
MLPPSTNPMSSSILPFPLVFKCACNSIPSVNLNTRCFLSTISVIQIIFIEFLNCALSMILSALEMPTSDPSVGHPPPTFFDLSALRTDTTLSPPHQSTRGKSPTKHPKSPNAQSSSSSPSPSPSIHSILSLDTSMARRETTLPYSVHPLPLPPWAGPGAPIVSPPAIFSLPIAKTKPFPMKNQWQKGKLIGRGTFGSAM